jgi:urea transport system substrate-binding protein
MTESHEPLIVIAGINRRKFIKYGSLSLGTSILAACSSGQTTSTSASSPSSSPAASQSPAASGADVIKVGVM